MMDCFRRLLPPSLVLLMFAGAFLGSCTDIDDRLGLGLLPDDQEMVFSEAVLDGIKSYMAFSDSLPINQKNMMILGNYTTDGYGHIRSGAAIQFVPSGFTDTEDFYGYFPIADSVKFVFTFSQVFGDTTKEQKFYIYRLKERIPVWKSEVGGLTTDDDEDARINYFPGFPAEDYADMDNPLFSFTLGAETAISVKDLVFESGADEFLKELINTDTAIYNNTYADSLFHNKFHGWYIAPSPDPAEAPLDAGLYIISPLTTYDTYYYSLSDDTYFVVYSRSFYKDPTPEEMTDPVIIDGQTYYAKDTLYTYYTFDDTYISFPNTNIIVLDRDYSSATLFNESEFIDPDDFESGRINSFDVFYVQGLLGVAGYLDFGTDFMDQLEALTWVDGEQRILNVNRATMHVWLEDDGVPYLNKAPTRLGMYYTYKGSYPLYAPDYNYIYESTYEYETAYGGYINRAMGYYEMDITSYVRNLANKTDDTQKQVWLAPDMTTGVMFSPSEVALVNPRDDGSGNPDHKRISVKLTYTLHKKAVDDR